VINFLIIKQNKLIYGSDDLYFHPTFLLVDTGYIHNRLHMIVDSFLVKNFMILGILVKISFGIA
jgi:hypothetical protein